MESANTKNESMSDVFSLISREQIDRDRMARIQLNDVRRLNQNVLRKPLS